MLQINAKITRDSDAATIANLQAALDALGFGAPIPPDERNARKYGQGTTESVRRVQAQVGLHDAQPGVVDERTAEAINKLLFERGVFRRVSGRAFRADGGPLAGNLLFAFDRDNVGGAYLGQANANADGAYAMFYDPRLYAQPGEGVLRVKDVIDLIVQVYDAAGTTLAESPPIHDPDRQVQVDLREGERPPPRPYVVRGRVVDAGGAVAGVEVRVFDRDLGDTRQQLGDGQPARTAADGSFEIRYGPADFESGEGEPPARGKIADLLFEVARDGAALDGFQVVRLYPSADGRPPTETSVSDEDRVLGIPARPDEEVRITLPGGTPPRGPSEYERLWQAIEPMVTTPPVEGVEARERRVGAAAAVFDEAKYRDISFVAREIEWDRSTVALFAGACQRAGEADHAVPTAVFYGLARDWRSLTTWADLAATSAADLKAILLQSADDGVIPPLDADLLASSIERIGALASAKAADAPPDAATPAFGERIRGAGLNADEQAALLRTAAEAGPNAARLWDTLKAAPGFAEEGRIERVQAALQIDTLTQGHVPLMTALQMEHGVTAPRDLLALGEDTLREMVGREDIGVPDGVPGDDGPAKAAAYVASVMGALHLALPTESVARLVGAAPAEAVGDAATQATLTGFFERATGAAMRDAGTAFDIGATNIQEYLAQHGDTVFEGIAAEERAGAVPHLMRAQRLFNVSADPASFQTLLTSGLGSAREIASMPLATFMDRFAPDLGEQQTMLMHSRAMGITTSSLEIYTTLHDALYGLFPNAVHVGEADPREGMQQVVGKHIPNWRELFGAPELCECQDCRSVTSPAAYLVDVLHFLEGSKPNAAGFTPLDVLIGKPAPPGGKGVIGRRPDLAHLKLSCENTNTAIPYVDLVNEALESLAIAYSNTAEQDGHIAVDYAAIPAYDTGNATTPELQANPQYTALDAYRTDGATRARLDRAVYPLSLPYDQALETARVYLKQLGAELSDVLSLLVPQDGRRWAAEMLGLSPADFAVITGEQLTGGPADALDADAAFGLTPELLPALKQNARGRYVAALKRKLNAGGAALALAADPGEEVFDAATTAAVRAFQQANALPDDGVVKIAEWRLLAPLAPSVAAVVLPGAREFLARAGVSYAELLSLAQARYVNPAGPTFDVLTTLRMPYDDLVAFVAAGFINPSADLLSALADAKVSVEDFTAWASTHLDADGWARMQATLLLDAPMNDACDLEHTTLRRWERAQPDVDDATWLRLNRLIRLWRRTGWALPDLDRALVALGAAELTPDVLVQLAQIRRAAALLDVSIADVVSLWAPLDIGPGSLYRRRFLSKAALRHDRVFAPDWKGDVLIGAKLADHTPAILAGLRLKALDLDAILTDIELADADLTADVLQRIARYATLARALGRRPRDLTRLRRLWGQQPFVPPSVDWPLLQLADLAALVEGSDLSIAQLDYIYRQGVGGSPIAPPADVVQNLVTDLRGGLGRIADEFAVTDDPTGDLTTARLTAALDDAALANGLRQIMDGSASYSQPLRALPPGLVFAEPYAARLVYDTASHRLTVRGALTMADKDALDALSADADYRAALAALADGPRQTLNAALAHAGPVPLVLPDAEAALLDTSSFDAQGAPDPAAVAAKFHFILLAISPALRQARQRDLVKQTLAQALALDAATMARLIEGDAAAAALLHAVDDAAQPMIQVFLALVDAPDTAAAARAYVRLHKAALLITAFKLNEAEVRLAQGRWVDFNALPVEATDDTAPFARWPNLARYASVRRRLPKSLTPLAGVLAAPDDGAAITTLTAATGWPEAVVTTLAGPTGFGWGLADLQAPANLARLASAVRLLERLGISAEQALAWTGPLDHAAADDIKRATRASYDEATWADLARSLSDPVRDSQKSALIAYLLPRLGIETADKLYEHLLIDVEMSPCMMTSRVKQAVSSVQMFIQRCLMNLEPDVPPSAIDAEQWEWMARLPIWAANRQVFLYPENLLEQDWRDDKTPFFKELESDLLQNDLTAETAEKALLTYLEKLDGVAKLQMCGLWLQDDFEAGEKFKEIVHLFGRTPNPPYNYYYRRYIVSANDLVTWTPWEKVQLDIRGDRIAPVVWNRRLYLFWPIVANKREEEAPHAPYSQLQIGWSEYSNGKWSPKNVSDPEETLRLESAEPSGRGLHAYLSGDTLTLVYSKPAVKLVCLEPSIDLLTGKPRPAGARSAVEEKAEGTFVFDNCHARPRRDTTKWFQVYKDGLGLPGPSSLAVLGDGLHCGQSVLDRLPDTGLDTRLVEQRGAHPGHDYFLFEDGSRTYLVRMDKAWHSRFGQIGDGKLIRPDLVFDVGAKAKGYDVTKDLGRPYLQQIGQTAALGGHAWSTANARIAALSLQAPGDVSVMAGPRPDAGAGAGVARIAKDPAYAFARDFGAYVTSPDATLRYETLFHPFVCEFIKGLRRDGVPGLLNLDNQRLTLNWLFQSRYQPNAQLVAQPYPVESVDFGQSADSPILHSTAYSTYNMELVFHAPMLIAGRLAQNFHFPEAIRWLQYVFNFTDGQGDFWKVLPFRRTPKQQIDDLLAAITARNADATKSLAEWRDNPFRPHLIARRRPIAYMKHVVMKCVEVLCACGDYYFRQDSIESINIATQYYVMAANLLGPRPEQMPARGDTQPRTFAELRSGLDAFGNALVDFENRFPLYSSSSLASSKEAATVLGLTRSSYFCIPQNDKLLGYWDLVADRLFKIRHCMNIEGVVRELPLWDPPIDPALLVQAVAQGLDLGSVLADLSAPLPSYRFRAMFQRAVDVANDLKSLGALMLSTLEKRDAEALALMRQQHERTMLDLVRTVRQMQIEEANTALEALQKSRDTAVTRYLYYQELLGADSLATPPPGANLPMQSARKKAAAQGGAHLIEEEQSELASSHSARDWQIISSRMEILANLSFYIPTLTIVSAPQGAGTHTELSFGGKYAGPALSAIARYQRSLGEEDSYRATHAGAMAKYVRREQEWVLQSNLAAREIMQIDKQILAAKIRIDIAKQELKNQEQAIAHAEAVEDFLRNKYTNDELYSWMQGRLSEAFFQTYQVAVDLAKKAERCYRFEYGLKTSSFIKGDAWDSARKGLLAGERLTQQLRQLERAYLDGAKREYEITRHVSLVQLDPVALIRLKQTGTCEFSLPETLFDLDYPGHYFRRIKSVSLTVPAVVGPYTSLNATLTLLKNQVRISPLGQPYPENLDEADNRFEHGFVAIQSIAASQALGESGLFELSFNDERYLPFEGAGAISTWRLTLPDDFRAFDYDTISDVVLTLRYTAREGGDLLKGAAVEALRAAAAPQDGAPLVRMFSLRHEFPTQWHAFLFGTTPDADHPAMASLPLDLGLERFQFAYRGPKMNAEGATLFLKFKDGQPADAANALDLWLAPPSPAQAPGADEDKVALKANPRLRGLLMAAQDVSSPLLGRWLLAARRDALAPLADAVEDVIVVFHYTSKVSPIG
ncbi:MAG: neuraminidase-like domain-containing protein [Anaerolineae bacterium]